VFVKRREDTGRCASAKEARAAWGSRGINSSALLVTMIGVEVPNYGGAGEESAALA